MGKRKHKLGDWHHRVPDFKLVYCGTKKRLNQEETKELPEKRFVEAHNINLGKLQLVKVGETKAEQKKLSNYRT